MMDESNEALLQFPPLREMAVSVCGFPEDTTEMDVRAYFSKFGTMVRVSMIEEKEKSFEDEHEMDIEAQVGPSQML
jgi:RNA recognition motif-containing protein